MTKVTIITTEFAVIVNRYQPSSHPVGTSTSHFREECNLDLVHLPTFLASDQKANVRLRSPS